MAVSGSRVVANVNDSSESDFIKQLTARRALRWNKSLVGMAAILTRDFFNGGGSWSVRSVALDLSH